MQCAYCKGEVRRSRLDEPVYIACGGFDYKIVPFKMGGLVAYKKVREMGETYRAVRGKESRTTAARFCNLKEVKKFLLNVYEK